MPREIDLGKPLGEADEHELLIRLGQVWSERERGTMTRGLATDAHHQILYAIGDLKHIQVRLEADMFRNRPIPWQQILEACMQAINNLSSLASLARTGRGGTSHLHDRNEEGQTVVTMQTVSVTGDWTELCPGVKVRGQDLPNEEDCREPFLLRVQLS